MCFKLGQLSGISIVDKERPFSYAAVLLLLLLQLMLLLFVVVVVVVVVGGGGGVCFKLGQLSGISIVDKERPFSYAAALCCCCCCCCWCCCAVFVVVVECVVCFFSAVSGLPYLL